MTKIDIIEKITSIIKEWGPITTKQLCIEMSPVYCFMDRNNYRLIESFNEESITVMHYLNDSSTNESEYSYNELTEDILEEIMWIIDDYNNDMINETIYQGGSI